MKVEKLTCRWDSTIKDAMACIDDNTKGTVFIVEDRKSVV